MPYLPAFGAVQDAPGQWWCQTGPGSPARAQKTGHGGRSLAVMAGGRKTARNCERCQLCRLKLYKYFLRSSPSPFFIPTCLSRDECTRRMQEFFLMQRK